MTPDIHQARNSAPSTDVIFTARAMAGMVSDRLLVAGYVNAGYARDYHYNNAISGFKRLAEALGYRVERAVSETAAVSAHALEASHVA